MLISGQTKAHVETQSEEGSANVDRTKRSIEMAYAQTDIIRQNGQTKTMRNRL
jgi:hypothetical protein